MVTRNIPADAPSAYVVETLGMEDKSKPLLTVLVAYENQNGVNEALIGLRYNPKKKMQRYFHPRIGCWIEIEEGLETGHLDLDTHEAEMRYAKQLDKRRNRKARRARMKST